MREAAVVKALRVPEGWKLKTNYYESKEGKSRLGYITYNGI